MGPEVAVVVDGSTQTQRNVDEGQLNFQKVKTLRVMAFKEYDNRYREAATSGG